MTKTEAAILIFTIYQFYIFFFIKFKIFVKLIGGDFRMRWKFQVEITPSPFHSAVLLFLKRQPNSNYFNFSCLFHRFYC